MCWKTLRKGLCGHKVGNNSWGPENPEDCREARLANRRHARTGKLLRCSPPGSTTVVQDDTIVCGEDECYITYVLIGRGWTCHRCGFANEPGVDQCQNEGETEAGYDFCGHFPCNDPNGCKITQRHRRR
ncbi:hypothetical protein F4819DRAFT_156904 [Hypoxylon fuscum]|nr:hypothetical protein F4819DRAFT_156904 [Hypoxylon fuscum]